ncbi:MAG: hypothetical protein R2688_05440 [Fimbriimonadaceae bacterium]
MRLSYLIWTKSGDHAVAIGSWNEGIRKVDVEWVVPLDGKTMSRWLGWLSVREGLEEPELKQKWSEIGSYFGSETNFLVILSSYPKKTPFDLADAEPQPDIETRDVRFVVMADGSRAPVSASLLAFHRAQDRQPLEDFAWWLETPIADSLGFTFSSGTSWPIIERGDYACAWWLVSTDASNSDSLTLEVLSRRKIRSATFNPEMKPAPQTVEKTGAKIGTSGVSKTLQARRSI